MEFRQTLVRLLLVLPLLLIYAPVLGQRWSETRIPDKNWWDVTAFFPFVLLIAVIVGGAIRNLWLIIMVQKEIPLPRQGCLWNRNIMVQIFVGLWACTIAFTCFWFRLYFQGSWAVLALLLLIGEFLYGLRASKKQGKDYCLWKDELPPVFKIAGSGVVVLLLFASFTYTPISDSYYRFSLQCSADEFKMEYHDSWENEEIYSRALNQEDAAFSTEAVEGRFKENPGHYTDFERIVYIQDSYPVGIEHAYEKWFYVGTLTSRLLNIKKLEPYLKEKHLTLEGAEKYNLVQGVDSYFLPSGKEIVHVSGDMIVIHFLDKRDERNFTLKSPASRTAVADKTEKILEMYYQ